MKQDQLVRGVLLGLSKAKEPIARASMRLRIALLLTVVLALSIVTGLVGLALRSNSGIGLPVVGATVLVCVATPFFRRLLLWVARHSIGRRNGQKAQSLRQQMAALLLSIVLVSGLGGLLAGLLLPAEGISIVMSIAVGGGALTALMSVLVVGYPKMRDRGTPALLATAGLVIVFAIVYMTAVSLYIVPYKPFTLDVGRPLEPPSPQFPLGTTSLGQDLLSRTIAGGATMLQVAVLSVSICFIIGVPVGLAASFWSGKVDRVVSLIMDSIFAFPGLVLAIAIAAMLGPGVVNMALAIAVVYVPSYYRVIRSQVFTIRELPYVEAARVMGAPDRSIMLRYILPNVLPSSIVVMSLNFADAVLTAAGLTFVGLGLPIDIADWGWDLTFGWLQLLSGAWWVITFPGLMIVLLALGFTLAGEGFNEILTPRLRE